MLRFSRISANFSWSRHPGAVQFPITRSGDGGVSAAAGCRAEGASAPKLSGGSISKSPTAARRGKRMFATTSGHVDKASFSELFDFARVIPARPRCIFGNGDDTASAHSGARSERVRWMLLSRPCFRDAGRLTTHPSLLATRSPEGQVNVTQALQAQKVPGQRNIVPMFCSREARRAQPALQNLHCADIRQETRRRIL